MFKKLLNLTISIITTIFIFQNICLASVAILKNDVALQSFSKINTGSNENYLDKFLQTFTDLGTDYKLFDETTIKNIKYAENHILIVPCAVNLSPDTINAIKNYVGTGGKLVIINSHKMQDLSTLNELAKIIGVNVTQIDKTTNIKYTNWIEQDFNLNNSFSIGSTISKIETTKDTEVLAVWDEIEKNEPAVTINQNGSYINWLWGIDGDKAFNVKNLQTILNKLDPKTAISETNVYDYNDFLKKVQKIQTERKNCEKLYDILKLQNWDGYSEALQEYLALSELYEVSAQDAFAGKNYENSYKMIDEAQKYVVEAYKLIVNSEIIEGRGIWFDRGTIASIKNQDQMSKIFDNIKKSGINTVYFETVNAGYSVYPSKIIEQNPLIKGIDPLKCAVEEAKKRNIQIHPWIWVFAGGNDRHNPIINLPDSYQGPTFSKHPDWALIGEKGNFKPDNQHEFWLDPSDKNVRNHLISLAEEIVENYDVDGIHLDYIRYPFQNENNLMGFNKSSLDKFEKDTGYKITEITPNTLNVWNSWKENNINTFMKDISTSLRKIKPDIIISAAIFGKSNSERKNTIQQNWEKWVANGWVDMLNPMIYALNKDNLTANLSCFNESINKNVLIYPGIALKHLEEPEIAEQMNIIKNHGLLGSTIFAVAFLNDKKSDFLNNEYYKSSNKITPLKKNNLYLASILLQEYSTFIQNFLNNSSEMNQDDKSSLYYLVNESNNIVHQLNSPPPDVKNIKLCLKNFKSVSQNTLNIEFKNNPGRIKSLSSNISRAETLINLELQKLQHN